MEFNKELANEYDKGIRRTFPAYDAMLKMSNAYLGRLLGDEASLLLVGAGGGNELATFGGRHPGWRFTAVDPSKEMLDIAGEKARSLGLSGRTQLIHGTAADVGARTEFDAATCLLVIHFIEDDMEKTDILQAINRRLKPEAPFILAAMYGDSGSAEYDRLVELWKTYWLETTKLTEEEVDEMEESVRKLSFQTGEAIEENLRKAGFKEVTQFLQAGFFGCWICYAE